MQKSKSRFTLVELLVVIAIISILAGMLLPALSKAMDAAVTTACANLQKQLGMSYRMYANDWRDRTPVYYDGSDSWAKVLYERTSYIEDKSILVCPAWKYPHAGWVGQFYVYGNVVPYTNDQYIIKASVGGGSTTYGFNFRLMLAPSNVPLFTDSIKLRPGSFEDKRQYYSVTKKGGWAGNAASMRCWHFRHNSRVNVVLGDMHVSSYNSVSFLELDGMITSDPPPAYP